MPLAVKDIMDCIENPVKTQILLLLQEKRQATAKEMRAANPGIPQATLYRSLKSMEAVGIVEVVAEAKVRAVTEKTYAISEQFANMENELIKNNDGKAYCKLFSGFVLGLLKKFERYAKIENLDIAADGSSFTAVPLYATAEQLAECHRQIHKILQPLATKQNDSQKLYTLATIVTPPIEQENQHG